MIDTGKVIAEGTSDELKQQVGERIELTVARHGSLEHAREVRAGVPPARTRCTSKRTRAA